jgi:hypothetical protein
MRNISGLTAKRIGGIEEDLAWLLARCGKHVLGVGISRAERFKRFPVYRLGFDEKVLAGGEVPHQRRRPAPIRSADVDHGS